MGASDIEQGDLVDTPGGTGRVVYVRMAAPDFSGIEAVSVLLDGFKRSNPYYVGTVFLAGRVKLLEKAPKWL